MKTLDIYATFQSKASSKVAGWALDESGILPEYVLNLFDSLRNFWKSQFYKENVVSSFAGID
jgi:hypothetical protein